MAKERKVIKKLPVLAALGLAGAAAILLAKVLRDSLNWDIDWDGALDDYNPHRKFDK